MQVTVAPPRRGAPRRASPLRHLTTYLDAKTSDAIDRAAANEGLSRSTFVRRLILRAVGTAAVAEAAR